MYRKFIILMLFILLSSACSDDDKSACDMENDDCEIYSLVINENYFWEDDVDICVIWDSTLTIRPDDFRYDGINWCIRDSFQITDTTFINDFFNTNLVSKALDNKFDIPVPVHMLTDEEWEELCEPSVSYLWVRFYEKFPHSNGYFNFSSISYSAVKDQALIYYVHVCNELWGSGTLALMKKEKGKWEYLQSVRIWVSK